MCHRGICSSGAGAFHCVDFQDPQLFQISLNLCATRIWFKHVGNLLRRTHEQISLHQWKHVHQQTKLILGSHHGPAGGQEWRGDSMTFCWEGGYSILPIYTNEISSLILEELGLARTPPPPPPPTSEPPVAETCSWRKLQSIFWTHLEVDYSHAGSVAPGWDGSTKRRTGSPSVSRVSPHRATQG